MNTYRLSPDPAAGIAVTLCGGESGWHSFIVRCERQESGDQGRACAFSGYAFALFDAEGIARRHAELHDLAAYQAELNKADHV